MQDNSITDFLLIQAAMNLMFTGNNLIFIWLRKIVERAKFQLREKMVKIGIIGGTGLGDILSQKEELIVPRTPWGDAAPIYKGNIGDVPCFLLSRHGKNHEKSPTQGIV